MSGNCCTFRMNLLLFESILWINKAYKMLICLLLYLYILS